MLDHVLNMLIIFHVSVKVTYNVEEYGFGQSTLEQVFIEFAKQQEEADKMEDMEDELRNGSTLGVPAVKKDMVLAMRATGVDSLTSPTDDTGSAPNGRST